MRRFAAPERRLAFWVVGWVTVAVAVLAVLVPLLTRGPTITFVEVTVVFRIVGGSFAACGLVAWRRRPDNHSGRLMTATGFAFLASPLLAQLDAPLARTSGLLLRNLWLLFLDMPGNLLFLWPDARTAATVVLTTGLVGLPVPYAVFWVLAFSVAMVPVAFLTGLLRSRLARGGLVELFRGMRAMHPADLRAAPAREVRGSRERIRHGLDVPPRHRAGRVLR